jgi:hypothetical protein
MPQQFSEQVITQSRCGKLEVRALEARGRFVLCKYLDPTTLKLADQKLKLSLLDDDGNLHEYFIIPTKAANRSLLIHSQKPDRERKVWNPKTKKEEDLW